MADSILPSTVTGVFSFGRRANRASIPAISITSATQASAWDVIIADSIAARRAGERTAILATTFASADRRAIRRQS